MLRPNWQRAGGHLDWTLLDNYPPKELVRVVGIEPTLLAEPDFESGASTSFTTPAHSPPIIA